jgi:arylsulfatase A-like enzyme
MVTGQLTLEYAERVYDHLVEGSKPIFLWVHFFDAHRKYLEHPGIDFGKGQRALYDGEVRFVDNQLGLLLEHVAAGRRSKRTLWVVHGSHGEAFGEHDKTGHGGTLIYDEVAWVPLVFSGPGVHAGRFGGDAVSIMDVAPTLLELAGVEGAKGLAGVSLAPALAAAKGFERPPVMVYATHRTAVVDWPLKLLVRRREDERERTLLFDLERDPGESHDISGDHEADVRRLNSLRKNED